VLRFDDVQLLRGGRAVLSGVSLTIHAGHKVGVTGRNGAGKTSFVELVTGGLEPDAGRVEITAGYDIAYVTQELEMADRAAIEHVMDGDRELRGLQAELGEAEARQDGHRQAAIHARLEAIDAYTAATRAARIMAGLGFSSREESAPVGTFSGGWRMRLHLARALMCRSHVLVLDEPTNHLDLDAVIWLESWLRAYEGTLLLISHDREFLDPVVDHVAHVERGRVRLYAGNYSSFERRRSLELGEAQATYQRQQREIAHMRAFVDRFRYKATKARQAQSRLKALARMELIAPAHVDSPFHLRFEAPLHLPTPLVRLESLGAGYPDRAVLEGVSMSLAPGDRLALLGANGAGKSTLIKVLAGELMATSGVRHEANRLGVGYFSQHRVEQLDAEDSPMAHLARLDRQSREQGLQDFLGGFGFGDQRVHEPVSRLSGGEQARLALALILYQRPNLLLLDEPTNHLDLEMRHALAVALQEFAGAVVIVSHDRHLLRTVSDSLWLVADGGAAPYDGDLDDYARWLATRRQAAAPGQGGRGAGGARDARARRRADAERRRAVQPLRREVERLESELARLGGERAVLADALTDPAIYADDAKARLKAMLLERGRIEGELADTESAWMAASERLEAALAQGESGNPDQPPDP
jgi:ATP-binding cassette subfamily F protein 3